MVCPKHNLLGGLDEQDREGGRVVLTVTREITHTNLFMQQTLQNSKLEEVNACTPLIFQTLHWPRPSFCTTAPTFEMILGCLPPAYLMDISQEKKKNGNFKNRKQNRNLQNYSYNKRAPLTPNKPEKTHRGDYNQARSRMSFPWVRK